tara:strand:+ start:479 stop:736 length:258 start_codon:yes stop_codon:yes gene_type:complete
MNNLLLVGPFSEIEERIDEFTSSIFASLMMMESMDRLEAAEQEYKIARAGKDEKRLEETERTLRACEVTVQITIGLLDPGEELSQ